MRRSIVFTLLALAAAAALLAPAGPAGASSRSAHIVCPERSGVIPPPCCPTPPGAQMRRAEVQPVCCQTVPCCPATTCCATSGTCCTPTTCAPAVPTITSSPWPSRAGQKVVISGTGTSGAQVALWRELSGQSSFHQISTTTADSSGKYTFTRGRGTVMTDQEYYVISDGAQSATLSQQVEALVALASSARSTKVGRAIVLRGNVTPSHAGDAVLIEMRRGSTWRVIARPRLGRRSGYSVRHRFAKSGSFTLRVVLQRDSRNDRSTSTALTLTVKP